jgi:hypothetical protein
MGDGMENSLSSEHRDFLQLLRCLLKSKGISYIQGQIEDFIEMVIQFNPFLSIFLLENLSPEICTPWDYKQLA